MQFKKNQEMFQLKNEERILLADIASADSGQRMLQSKINK
jgi:hypothetical protein